LTDAVKSLGRFVYPLAFYNEGSEYELSMVGSAFAIRVLGCNVLISSLHQLDVGGTKRNPGEAVMVIDTNSGSLAITGNAFHRVKIDQYGVKTEQDVLILRFADCHEGRCITPNFCRLDSEQFMDHSDIPFGGELLAYVAIGFPNGHRSYEFGWAEETSTVLQGDVRSRWVRVYLDAAAPSAWDKDGLVPFQIDSEQVNAIGDLDGLSGSPILMIWQGSDLQAHLAIAGMVLYGSKTGRLNAFPGRRLGDIIAKISRPMNRRATDHYRNA